MDATDALESLSNLLTSLSESPYSLELHAKHIQLASLPELADQFEDATQLMTSFFAATDQVWLPFLQRKIKCLGIPDDFESLEEPLSVSLDGMSVELVLDVLESFRKAANDYLSIQILRQEIKLLIVLHASFIADPSKPDLEPLLGEDAVRLSIASAASQGLHHLTQGYILWDLHITWELARLAEKPQDSPQRDILKAHIDSLHLERLRQPHSTHEETLQSYSSFVSAYYDPGEYERCLVSASKLRIGAAEAWDRREQYELALGDSPSRDGYQNYIMNEHRMKPANALLLDALYGRITSDLATRRWQALVDRSDPQLVNELENDLQSFWCSYIDYGRQDNEEQREMAVIQKAIRSVPGCGEVWAKYIRAIEREGDDTEIEMQDDQQDTVAGVYAKALSTSLVQKNVEQVIPLVLAKAGYEKRRLKDKEGFDMLVKTLEDGLSIVRNDYEKGDQRLRLEKFLAGVFMTLETPLTDQTLSLWHSTAKHYKSSFLAWSKYAELLIAEREYTRARALFKDMSHKNIDWPEAIWQLWGDFEHLHGSVEDLEYCLEKVKLLSAKLEKKRAQEAAEVQRAWLDASRLVAEPSNTILPVTETGAESVGVTSTEGVHYSRHKRKAEEPEGSSVSSKRAKIDDKPAIKRDRENSTVFISGLVSGVTEIDINTLFKDCGKIREIKVTELDKSVVATVEFNDRESVPAALTKDKKRLQDGEIAVHLAWQSTLYVTNFPETTDDASIRKLFGDHGEIFDVRWPSKKYKSTRRFCYVQYTTPTAAALALSLHGYEAGCGRELTVYISNPERKQERSDASADAREIYVAGLSKSVNEKDLRKLFEPFGQISSIRLILDEKGSAKGFAFVEFEKMESANAALSANNQELKKRRIAVTLADTRFQSRQREGVLASQARRSRSLRVSNLPPETQEGLLQQTLEKYATISRIEVFLLKNEAVVELPTVSEAGRLLLTPEPIIFGGRELKLIEDDLLAPVQKSSGPMFVPRGAAGRPRAGIGSKKNLSTVRKETSSGIVGSSKPVASSSTGKGQDDFRRMLGPDT